MNSKYISGVKSVVLTYFIIYAAYFTHSFLYLLYLYVMRPNGDSPEDLFIIDILLGVTLSFINLLLYYLVVSLFKYRISGIILFSSIFFISSLLTGLWEYAWILDSYGHIRDYPLLDMIFNNGIKSMILAYIIFFIIFGVFLQFRVHKS